MQSFIHHHHVPCFLKYIPVVHGQETTDVHEGVFLALMVAPSVNEQISFTIVLMDLFWYPFSRCWMEVGVFCHPCHIMDHPDTVLLCQRPEFFQVLMLMG